LPAQRDRRQPAAAALDALAERGGCGRGDRRRDRAARRRGLHEPPAGGCRAAVFSGCRRIRARGEGTEWTEVTATEQTEVTVTEQTEVTATEQTEVTATEQTEITVTEATEITVSHRETEKR